MEGGGFFAVPSQPLLLTPCWDTQTLPSLLAFFKIQLQGSSFIEGAELRSVDHFYFPSLKIIFAALRKEKKAQEVKKFLASNPQFSRESEEAGYVLGTDYTR